MCPRVGAFTMPHCERRRRAARQIRYRRGSTMNPDRLEGSFVALVTPMTAELAVHLDALARLARRQMEAGSAGLVVAGTTGESASLSRLEYEHVLERVVAEAGGRVPVIAGVGAASTAHALELAQTAERCGADALLAVTPYYLRTTQQGLYGHYAALADQVGLPIVLYNVPARTGNDLEPETVARLARRANIVGLKEAVADESRVRALIELLGEDFALLSGDDASALRSMLVGARGVVSVTANVAPAAMQRLTELARAGAAAEAKELDRRLEPLHRVLMSEPNPIPVKNALARLGLIEPGIRLPLVPASPRLAKTIEQILSGDVRQLIDA